MTLIKYRPAREIDALFNHLAHDFWPSACGTGVKSKDATQASRLPRTNVRETEDAYVFTMEMPGLGKKDVEVTVEGDELTVRGQRTEEKEDTNGLVRREIRSTRFERTFDLAGAVDPDSIKAKIEEGVLTVTLPKKPEKVGRKIDVA
jgi:HSP20 family protein